MNSSLSSNICDQNVNFFTKRSEMKATRSPAETAKYVTKAKLVSSLRDTILANFGLFRRQKNGFGVVYNKFLLSFHNKHILSCKKMQKKISLHIHFKALEIFGIKNKTIIEFGFRMICIIIQTSEDVIQTTPSEICIILCIILSLIQ